MHSNQTFVAGPPLHLCFFHHIFKDTYWKMNVCSAFSNMVLYLNTSAPNIYVLIETHVQQSFLWIPIFSVGGLYWGGIHTCRQILSSWISKICGKAWLFALTEDLPIKYITIIFLLVCFLLTSLCALLNGNILGTLKHVLKCLGESRPLTWRTTEWLKSNFA